MKNRDLEREKICKDQETNKTSEEAKVYYEEDGQALYQCEESVYQSLN